jgi:negative regulator of flagellin synthesis FlgM
MGVASKISGIGTEVASVGAGRAVQRPQDAVTGGASSETASKDAAENVQITGTARQLADLEQKVRDLPAVNEARVVQLRTAIEQGTYTVRPEHIADQLMSLERALGHLPDSAESDSSNDSGNSGQ